MTSSAAAPRGHTEHLKMEQNMTSEAMQSLPTTALRAIVNSTSPTGRFWLQLVWAKDELARRSRRAWQVANRGSGG
jgi:hypothetical protein